MVFRLCKQDFTKKVTIPYNYREDGTIKFYLTAQVLHAITRPHRDLRQEKSEFDHSFRMIWSRFLNRSAEELRVRSLSLMFGSIKYKKPVFCLELEALQSFLKTYNQYEIDWFVIEYIKEQVEEQAEDWQKSNIEILNKVNPSLFLPALNTLVPSENVLLSLERQRELDADTRKIINSGNICYILSFEDNKFYVGSTLTRLKDRLDAHYKRKGVFQVHALIQVFEGYQISGRTVETALHCICSEIIGVNTSSLEQSNNDEGYTVEFENHRGIIDVITKFLISETYSLKGKITFVECSRVTQISNLYFCKAS